MGKATGGVLDIRVRTYLRARSCLEIGLQERFSGRFHPSNTNEPSSFSSYCGQYFRRYVFSPSLKGDRISKENMPRITGATLFDCVFLGKKLNKGPQSLRLTFQKEVFPYCRRIIKCTDRSLTTRSQKSTDV